METKRFFFGIDCDPFCRNQQKFIDQVSKEIFEGKEIECVSKSFGAWEFVVEGTQSQKNQIWDLLNEYYSQRLCRGAFCEDPWNKKEKS